MKQQINEKKNAIKEDLFMGLSFYVLDVILSIIISII